MAQRRSAAMLQIDKWFERAESKNLVMLFFQRFDIFKEPVICFLDSLF